MKTLKWSAENSAALALVHQSARSTMRMLWICGLMVPAGLGSCAVPFLTMSSAADSEPTPAWIMLGIAGCLVGTAVGLVFLMRSPKFTRGGTLVATAQSLKMTFVFPSQERSWARLARSLNAWPNSDTSPGVAGLYVGERDGARFALLEWGTYDPSYLPGEKYIPFLYPMWGTMVFLVFPEPVPAERALDEAVRKLAAEARQEGIEFEFATQALAVTARGDMADAEVCHRLMGRAWQLRHVLGLDTRAETGKHTRRKK